MIETLQEFFDSRGVPLRVDRQAGVIRGVKILGLNSRNGRTYLPEALRQAAGLYEEAKVNVNHPKGNPGAPRDYQDRIGVMRGVVVREGEGLFADFHFNPKHALAEQLAWDAEHAAENVGFSHNVEARTLRRGVQVVVEAITRVQSVDLVADPATTRGLFEAATRRRRKRQRLPRQCPAAAGDLERRGIAAAAARPGRSVVPPTGSQAGRARRRSRAVAGPRRAAAEAADRAALAAGVSSARGRGGRRPFEIDRQRALFANAAGGRERTGDARVGRRTRAAGPRARRWRRLAVGRGNGPHVARPSIWSTTSARWMSRRLWKRLREKRSAISYQRLAIIDQRPERGYRKSNG